MHGIVFGPGLGRDDTLFEYLPKLFGSLDKQIAVCDADFLYFLIQKREGFDLIEKV